MRMPYANFLRRHFDWAAPQRRARASTTTSRFACLIAMRRHQLITGSAYPDANVGGCMRVNGEGQPDGRRVLNVRHRHRRLRHSALVAVVRLLSVIGRIHAALNSLRRRGLRIEPAADVTRHGWI